MFPPDGSNNRSSRLAGPVESGEAGEGEQAEEGEEGADQAEDGVDQEEQEEEEREEEAGLAEPEQEEEEEEEPEPEQDEEGGAAVPLEEEGGVEEGEEGEEEVVVDTGDGYYSTGGLDGDTGSSGDLPCQPIEVSDVGSESGVRVHEGDRCWLKCARANNNTTNRAETSPGEPQLFSACWVDQLAKRATPCRVSRDMCNRPVTIACCRQHKPTAPAVIPD